MATDPGRRRPSFDPSLAWATLAVVAVAAIIGVAILLTRPSPVEAPDASGSAVPSTAAPAALTVPGRPAAVEKGTWFRFGWQQGEERTDADSLRVGRLDGTVTAELDLPLGGPLNAGYGPPFVRGPRSGLILVVTGTANTIAANTALIQRLDATTGQIDDLLSIEGLVPDAVLTADGGFAYYLVATGDLLTAARIATDGTGAAEQVAAPRPRVAGMPAITLAATVRPHASLLLSDDESQLAILDCFGSCEVRVVTLATGNETMMEGFEGWAALGGWSEAGIGVGQVCVDPETGNPVEQECPIEQPLTGFAAGVELPDGWQASLVRVPGAAPMDFTLHAVAVGPDGQEVVLDALGDFIGQG